MSKGRKLSDLYIKKNGIRHKKRRNQSQNPKLKLLLEFTLKDFSEYFHMSLKELANEFDISLTLLKSICRSKGIRRWPYRQFRKIQNSNMSRKEVLDKLCADDFALLIESGYMHFKKINKLDEQKLVNNLPMKITSCIELYDVDVIGGITFIQLRPSHTTVNIVPFSDSDYISGFDESTKNYDYSFLYDYDILMNF